MGEPRWSAKHASIADEPPVGTGRGEAQCGAAGIHSGYWNTNVSSPRPAESMIFVTSTSVTPG